MIAYLQNLSNILCWTLIVGLVVIIVTFLFQAWVGQVGYFHAASICVVLSGAIFVLVQMSDVLFTPESTAAQKTAAQYVAQQHVMVTTL